MGIKAALTAGFAYFAAVYSVGFVLGALRVLLLVPRLGEFAAVALELPVILSASWFICAALVRQLAVPARTVARTAMGSFAFGLLLAAEAILAVWGLRLNLSDYATALLRPPGLLGLAGQIGFALLPLLQARLPSHSGRASR